MLARKGRPFFLQTIVEGFKATAGAGKTQINALGDIAVLNLMIGHNFLPSSLYFPLKPRQKKSFPDEAVTEQTEVFCRETFFLFFPFFCEGVSLLVKIWTRKTAITDF